MYFKVYITVHGPGTQRYARYSPREGDLESVIFDQDRRTYYWPARVPRYTLIDPQGLIPSVGLYCVSVYGGTMQRGARLTVTNAEKLPE